MERSAELEIYCSICNEPVDLKTTKTDDHGKAVHEDCYIMMHSRTNATHMLTEEVVRGLNELLEKSHDRLTPESEGMAS